MLESRSVRRAAALDGIHKNTSFRWRHRFPYMGEGRPRALDRPPRRRGGLASRRGISREHRCILVARDRSGKTFDFVTGRAPLTRRHLHRFLGPVIGRDIVLVSDGHRAYPGFAREAGIAHRVDNLAAGVRVDGALHVQNVNAYHSRFKQWLRRFDGVASRYLPNYLGWRWAVDGARLSAPEMLLRSALGAFTQLAVTWPPIE